MKRIFRGDDTDAKPTKGYKAAKKACAKAAAIELKAWRSYYKADNEAYKAKVVAHKARDGAQIAYAVYAKFKAVDADFAARVTATKAAKAAFDSKKAELDYDIAKEAAKAAKERGGSK
jgi:hypothetical protein